MCGSHYINKGPIVPYQEQDLPFQGLQRASIHSLQPLCQNSMYPLLSGASVPPYARRERATDKSNNHNTTTRDHNGAITHNHRH